MKKLIINIKELLQIRPAEVQCLAGKAMGVLPKIDDAFLLIVDDCIEGYGLMAECPDGEGMEVIDASGCVVLPTWCDSHTHLVYAGNRVREFVDRINGLSYTEIANRGGGILNSAKRIAMVSEEVLYEESRARLEAVVLQGTGAIEIKSGYGLSVAGELKMLRVIKALAKDYGLPIRATFLGAHAFPEEYRDDREGYIDCIINEMLPVIVKEGLAQFIDVFIETGYFTVAEAERIIVAGKKQGLEAKVHVNQFTAIEGVAMCVKHGVLSVDHLEVVTDDDIEVLKGAKTIAVALPSCSFFIDLPYTPARRMIDAGLPLALATDYNPGTTPSGNMNFVVATACIKMRMTPEEAINAATINGAYAMGVSETHGSVCVGKKANVMITKPISSFYEIPYAFGSQLIDKVFINGCLMEM